MKKTIMKFVSYLCCICMLISCVPMKAYATDGAEGAINEIIIKSTDTSVVTHTPDNTTYWKKPTAWSSLKNQIGAEYVQGIEGLYEDTDTIPRTSTKEATATYNLSAYEGSYQLYYLNLNQGTGAMTVTATITSVDNEVATITYDPTTKGNGEWLDFGTHKLGTTSSLVFSKPADSSGNFRDAAIKLVPVTEEPNPTASPIPTEEPTASPIPTASPTTNDIIIKASDTEKITFGDPSRWTETEWSQVKPTDTGFLAGVEGIFMDTDVTYTNSKNNNIKIDLTAYSGGTYKLYYLNLTTGTEANADGSDTARFSFRYDGTKASAINIDYKPLEYGNGEWILIDTYEIGSASIIYIQNNKSLTNFRAAALKLEPVAAEPTATPEPTASPEAPDNSVIITCNDSRVTHTGSWRDVAVGTVVGPTGEATKRTSSVYSNAVYDLSGFSGTYDIYFYNLNQSSSNTEAKVSVTKADGEVVYGIFDPTQKENVTWISMGTFELGEGSAFVLTNKGSNAKNLRNAAIKLVPNTSSTSIEADVTLAPYTPTWRTINEENPIILLSAVDDGATISYGWKPSSILYPTGKGFYTNTVGEWAKFMPYLTAAQDITLWYFVDGNANNAEDPALQVEIYAEGKVTTKTIDFVSGETRWEELGTFNFDGNGEEYIKFTKQTSDTTSRLTNLRLGYKSAVEDDEEEEIFSVYTGTEKEILQRIGLLTGTEDGITEAYIQTAPTATDLEVIKLKMNGQFEEAENYTGSTDGVSATDYAKMLLEQMSYVYGTDFDIDNIVSVAAEVGITVNTDSAFTIDALADMTVQALNAKMKGEKRSLLGSVMDKMEPIVDAKYTDPSVFTEAMREERETAKNRERTLIYNNDGNDTYVSYANYPGPFDISTVTEVMTHENFLSKRTTGLETSQVDSVFYGTGVYNSYHHNSAIADLRQRDWSPELFKTGEVSVDGTVDKRDSIQTVLDWCKTNNREFMWSMRMNDTHDKDYEVKYLDSFKQAHPDWLVSSRETCAVDLQLGALWSALDYAQQGVRQRSYDLLREVIMNYDVDGIELDFSRHSVYFKQVVTQAEDADPENIERMNNFMRSLRTLSEQVSAEKDKPILIAIHVADSMDFCKAIGLDVEQWMEEDLVDVVSIRTYGAYQYMEDGLAEYEDYDVPVYLIMDANNRGDDYDYSKEAALAYKAGYTGIQLYNVFNPASELFWTLGDESTVTYDASYTEKTRIPTDAAYAINATERFVTYGKTKDQEISFAESSVSKVLGDEDFTIMVNGAAEGSTVTYASSNTAVATVDAATGKVTICGAGNAEITATASATGKYNAATVTYTLAVAEKQPDPLEILIDGTVTNYKLKSNAVTTIHCTGALAEFESLKMDGTVIDTSNYELSEGSTIVTFKNAYLDGLSEGEHMVTLCYSDNRSIDSKLTIKAADTPKVEEDDDDDTGYVEDSVETSAADTASGSIATSATQTGDDSNIGLWMMMLTVAIATCVAVLVAKRKRE